MAGLVGKVIGGYRILAEIGQGGMATVYRAWDRRARRVVAVKFLSPFLCRDEKFRRRFRREAELLQRLRHPGIVPVLDSGEQDSLLYLVMPYISIGTLADRLKQGSISVEAGRRLMQQLSQAVQYAHDQGIVHRDLKPSNILVDRGFHAWLSDFGFARAHDRPSSISGSTVIGTPAYMSPEQILGHHVTPHADQYALGVILYQLCTGQVPYEGDTPMDQALKHATEPLPRPRAVNPRLPDAVEAVLVRALSKDPNFRYPSVAAFYRAFDAALLQSIDPLTGQVRPGAVGKPPRQLRRRSTPRVASPTLAGRTLAGMTRALLPTRGEKYNPMKVAGLILLLAFPLAAWGATQLHRKAPSPHAGQVQRTEDASPALNATLEALSTAFAGADAGSTPTAFPDGPAGGLATSAGILDAEEPAEEGSVEALADPVGAPTPAPDPALLGGAGPDQGPTPEGEDASEEHEAQDEEDDEVQSGEPDCSRLDLAGFARAGRKVGWRLHNDNPLPATLVAVWLGWPDSGGALFKISVDGSTVWVGEQQPPSVTVTRWIGGESSREISGTAELEFRFDADAAEGSYSVRLDFSGGCQVLAGS